MGICSEIAHFVPKRDKIPPKLRRFKIRLVDIQRYHKAQNDENLSKIVQKSTKGHYGEPFGDRTKKSFYTKCFNSPLGKILV